MRLTYALLTSLALVGCDLPAASPALVALPAAMELTAAQRAMVERGVKVSIANLATAKFEQLSATRSDKGEITVCGIVSVSPHRERKLPFTGHLFQDVFTVSAIAGSDESRDAVWLACSKAGIAPAPESAG